MQNYIKEILSKKELDIIKSCIDEELKRKPHNWLTGIYATSLKSYRKSLHELDYPSDINNIIFVINQTRMNKDKKKIVRKLNASVEMLLWNASEGR